MKEPRRGEVWWVDFGIAGKVRPTLVVSAPIANDDYALIAVVPLTTSPHPSRFSVALPVSGLKSGSFNVQGVTPVALSKFERRITRLDDTQMRAIEAALRRWLCLEDGGED